MCLSLVTDWFSEIACLFSLSAHIEDGSVAMLESLNLFSSLSSSSFSGRALQQFTLKCWSVTVARCDGSFYDSQAVWFQKQQGHEGNDWPCRARTCVRAMERWCWATLLSCTSCGLILHFKLFELGWDWGSCFRNQSLCFSFLTKIPFDVD